MHREKAMLTNKAAEIKASDLAGGSLSLRRWLLYPIAEKAVHPVPEFPWDVLVAQGASER